MEVEMDSECDSPQTTRHTNRSNTSGMNCFGGESSQPTAHPMPYSTQSLSRRLAPNSIGFQMTPTKLLLNQTRRSSSGIFITSMFGSRFRHLQKLHSEAFLGLNSICLPGLPIGAVFRSSLPATPVATPIHREAFHQFTEQAIRDRLCRTPSPRKNRGFLSLASQHTDQTSDQQMRSDSSCSQSGTQDSGMSDVQPMDITTPIIDEPVIEDTKEEESMNGSGFGEHYFGHNDRLERFPSDLSDRRLFVGNISYRVTETELKAFFRQFGKVFNCCIVKDHISRRPKGYGFITFKSIRDSLNVLNADPNELILDNRQLRVFRSEPKVCKQMKREVQELSEQRVLQTQYRSEESIELSNFVKLIECQKAPEFDNLDDDVILHIFSHLDSLRELTLLETVCKRWKSLMTQFWSTRSHISFANTFFDFECPALKTSTLFSIVKKCPNLRSIDLRHVTTFLDSKALEIISVSTPLLEKLIFDSGVTTDYALRVLGEKCQNIKFLYLNDCSFNERGFWWLLKNTPNLQVLEIRSNHKINGNCFRLLTEKLQTLDITNCPKIREKGFKELIAGNRSELNSLCISSISHSIIESISYNLKNLKILRISHFIRLNDNTNETITGFSFLKLLTNLEILEISAKFEDICNETVVSVITNCLKLKELLLVLNFSVNDLSITQIPQYLPHLQRLRATDSKISDESLIKFSSMKSLMFLDISGSYNVSDIGVQSLALNSKSLSLLQLNACDNISSDCFKLIVQTVSSDTIYPELIIVFNYYRINTKKTSFEEIDDLFNEEDFEYESY